MRKQTTKTKGENKMTIKQKVLRGARARDLNEILNNGFVRYAEPVAVKNGMLIEEYFNTTVQVVDDYTIIDLNLK